MERLGLHYNFLEFGEVEIADFITDSQLEEFCNALRQYGLKIINKGFHIKRILTAIRNLVNNPEVEFKTNFSDYISQKVHQNYHFLDNLFKEEIGKSIKEYYGGKKIERARELLEYYNLSLTEITYQLNYKSTSDLTNQFKKVTGLTPSFFKSLKQNKRVALENV